MAQTLSGIYAITHAASGRVYVGSARNLDRRRKDHLRELRQGVHPNQYLQRTWNSYGADAFVFTVLEHVPDLAHLLDREQYHIDHLDTTNRRHGFNICLKAGSRLGMLHREETKQRISVANSGKKRSAEHVAWLRARPISDETRQRLSAAGRGRRPTDTWRELMREKMKGRAAPWLRRDRCPQGHEKIGDNLYITPDGTRRCVICKREQFRAFKERQRAIAAGGQ